MASIRAFEKAAYTPVGEVVYARLRDMDRVALRPPDLDGNKLLGLE